MTPFLNIRFLTSLIVISSFAFVCYYSEKVKSEFNANDFFNLFNIFVPLFLLIVIYFTFYVEISQFWQNIYVKSSFDLNSEGVLIKKYIDINPDILRFKNVWLINYSMLFASILSYANFKWLKNKKLDLFNLFLNLTIILAFLLGGLFLLNELRESYLNSELPAYFKISVFHLMIRYISYGFFALLFYSTYRYVIGGYLKAKYRNIFEIVLSLTIVWLCSSELINWMDLSGSTQSYKLGLSILWGILSLLLIVYGIWKKKKYLRITAIALFGITLLKLFFYDIAHLETIPKTIVFVSLGSILLVISFLYNKYKHFIFDEDQN